MHRRRNKLSHHFWAQRGAEISQDRGVIISSRSNPTIKRVRGLRRRKEREAEGAFFVEGLRLVGEALDTGAAIDEVIITPRAAAGGYGEELIERVEASGVQAIEVTDDVFESIAGKENPQGIGAVVRQSWTSLRDARTGRLGWIALDAVQDPGNLGTILRTGDAVGADGVILLGTTTDPYDPTAVRASMGAIFNQQLARAEMDEFFAWARESELPIAATSDAADADYESVEYPTPLALLMGSEQKGLAPDVLARADFAVRIPMVGRSDSLNLAVATGIILYRIFSQHRGHR